MESLRRNGETERLFCTTVDGPTGVSPHPSIPKVQKFKNFDWEIKKNRGGHEKVEPVCLGSSCDSCGPPKGRPSVKRRGG